MPVSTIGRPPSLPHLDFGFIAPGQLRGCTFNATNRHMWIYRFGILGGRYTVNDPDNVTTRVALYSVDASMNPVTRLGYSQAMTVTAEMISWDGGAWYEANIDGSAVPFPSGNRPHLAVLGTVGSLGHGMQAAARITMDNERFYDRNAGLSQPPPNPFGSYVASNEGHLVIVAYGDDNEAPDTPSSLSPAGTINDSAPTFSAVFTDANQGRGDYLNQFRIQVRHKLTGTVMWNVTLTANSAERSASAFSRAYAGSTLTRGDEYEQRVQMSDYFGTWSAWTAWTAFLPADLGYITLDGNPTGKIETSTPDFDGKWTHEDGDDMTHVQVRIRNGAGNTILQVGAEYNIADVASSAAPGTAFTVPWANSGLNPLAWDASYQVQMRGRDEDGLWSDWSAPRSFKTNAAPSVPANLQPTNSLILTDYPLLTCQATDVDDTPVTGLVVYARIKNAAGTVLFTRSMTFNGSANRWEYQTDGTDLASFAPYRWDAYSYDGTLYSGEQTTSGAAVKSAEATFIYAEGPTVTITSPADGATITTADLTVSWTTSSQQKYRVSLYDGGTSTEIYTTGVVNSTVTNSVNIPSGYMRNDHPYDVLVWVEDGTPLSGESLHAIDVAFTPAVTVANFQAEAVKIGTDVWASAIRLTWDPSEYGEDWQEYILTRSATSGLDGPEIVLTRIRDKSDTIFIDYVPASGIEYVYTISQSILTGLDTLTSEPVSATAQVNLGGVVLCSVIDPEGLRTTLRHTAERSYPRKIDEAVFQPLSGVRPTTVRARTRVKESSFDAQLFDDAGATAAVRRDELEMIDMVGRTLCYRDNHGRKIFVTMPICTINDHVPNWFTAKITLRDERFSEGYDQWGMVDD